MSTVIAMGYLTYGADVHAGPNAARRLEEIRRLVLRMRSMAKDSEREAADAQMAYGVHVFARAKVIPDLAISRGQEAYRAGQAMGDRAMEFLAAGGTAMALLDIGEVSEADSWLGRAAQAAAAAPTPLRAWRLDLWRALVQSARGNAGRMREHFERALQTATAQGRASARCELLARFALEAARLGSQPRDEVLLELAERTAHEARARVAVRPPALAAQADAAVAEIASRAATSVEAAGREAAGRCRRHAETLPRAAAVHRAYRTDSGANLRSRACCSGYNSGRDDRLVDEDVRAFARPYRQWARLAGRPQPLQANEQSPVSVLARMTPLLALLTEGLTAAEIAAGLTAPSPAQAWRDVRESVRRHVARQPVPAEGVPE
jgi:hypothetical protein